MSINYVILKYNFLKDCFECVYSTTEKKLALITYTKYRYTYPYFKFILREESFFNEEY